MKRPSYTIKNAKVFLWSGEMAAWHFVGVPKEISTKIKEFVGPNRRGFGSVPVSVTIGKTTWNTSIFPDSKSGCYVLPLKAKVRMAEGVVAGETVTFMVTLR